MVEHRGERHRPLPQGEPGDEGGRRRRGGPRFQVDLAPDLIDLEVFRDVGKGQFAVGFIIRDPEIREVRMGQGLPIRARIRARIREVRVRPGGRGCARPA
jgi:hypothetical protein